jgi:hypothetical protein
MSSILPLCATSITNYHQATEKLKHWSKLILSQILAYLFGREAATGSEELFGSFS